jgi:hypothetical protein
MKSFSENFLKKVHKHCFKNKEELTKSEKCVCFHCFKVFTPTEIETYLVEKDEKETALCPCCWVDSILGDASGIDLCDELIDAMADYWFRGRTREEMKDFSGPEIVILD